MLKEGNFLISSHKSNIKSKSHIFLIEHNITLMYLNIKYFLFITLSPFGL